MLPVRHIPWCHTDNLSATFISDPHLPGKLEAAICATEKLDGSNLAIRARKDPATNEWTMLALQGRRTFIWQAHGTEHPQQKPWSAQLGAACPRVSYGNAGSLEKLPEAMLRFAGRIGTELAADDVMVFGEAFRCCVGNKQQRAASFHPFGVFTFGSEMSAAVDDDDESVEPHAVHMLNTALHTRFATHAIGAPYSTEDAIAGRASTPTAAVGTLFAHLSNGAAGFHIVCPPPVVYVGAFGGIAPVVGPLLTAAPPDVEGVFIIGEGGGPGGKMCCKWKSPAHEEQLNVPAVEEVAVMLQHFAATGKVLGRIAIKAQVDQLEADGMSIVDVLVPKLDPQFVDAFHRVAAVLRLKQGRCDAKAALNKTKVVNDHASKAAAVADPAVVALRARIITAFQREMTKDPALAPGVLATIPQPARKPVADRVVACVVAEVSELMEADAEAPPPTLAKATQTFVIPLVMKNGVDAYRV
jgi:hypothetical protein